jgi:hypothetical protein
LEQLLLVRFYVFQKFGLIKNKNGKKVGNSNVGVSNDLSNTFVYLLLAVVVVISILSMGLYFYSSSQELTPAKNKVTLNSPSPSATVSLEVVPPPTTYNQNG